MKLKSDFVTNSSSASFVVIGVRIDQQDIISIQRGPQIDDIYEHMDKLIRGSDLEYSTGDCNYDDSEVMIGMSYTQMQDDETLRQFKTRIQQQIKDVFGVDQEPYHIEECWMNN